MNPNSLEWTEELSDTRIQAIKESNEDLEYMINTLEGKNLADSSFNVLLPWYGEGKKIKMITKNNF